MKASPVLRPPARPLYLRDCLTCGRYFGWFWRYPYSSLHRSITRCASRADAGTRRRAAPGHGWERLTDAAAEAHFHLPRRRRARRSTKWYDLPTARPSPPQFATTPLNSKVRPRPAIDRGKRAIAPTPHCRAKSCGSGPRTSSRQMTSRGYKRMVRHSRTPARR
jgi:hypothetical protein